MQTRYTLYQILTRDDLDDNIIYKGFKACKQFVAATARGKRKERILSRISSTLKPYGIFMRLHWNSETNEVEYVAGQDYPSEMATLRDCFDWR